MVAPSLAILLANATTNSAQKRMKELRKRLQNIVFDLAPQSRVTSALDRNRTMMLVNQNLTDGNRTQTSLTLVVKTQALIIVVVLTLAGANVIEIKIQVVEARLKNSLGVPQDSRSRSPTL